MRARWGAFCLPIRFLVVDDSKSFLEAATLLLEREGLTIAGVASNCAEALHKAEALRPDVVLVDISLGEESGFDVLRHPTIDRLTSIREPAAASVRRLIEVGSDRS